jgi:prepilin-type N-terminal cleavage/methylation domain-containing protein
MCKAAVIMYTNKAISSQHRWLPTRPGFTLVELMIVIAVILLLMTITIAAFANFIVTSKEAATAATIAKLSKILQQRKEAFDRLSFKSAAKALKAYDNDACLSSRVAEVIVRKQRFQIALPQRWEERSLFNGFDYRTYFESLPSPVNYESSALLYLAITDGETFGAPQVDDDAFSTAEVTSIPITINGTNLDLRYFIDAWGQPIRFYRWPTGLIRLGSTDSIDRSTHEIALKSLNPMLPPQTSNASNDPLAYDPDDPTHSLYQYVNCSGNPKYFSYDPRQSPMYKLYFDLRRYHTPLLVSAGPDRLLGIMEPNDPQSKWNGLAVPITGSSSAVIDNLTNLNQRNKGK